MSPACLVAALAGGILLAGWIGYPMALLAVSRLKRARPVRRGANPPSGISVVIATRESPEVIHHRLLNLRDCELGGLPLEIVVGVDPRAPYALADYARVSGELGRFVLGDAPGGKACTLNAAVWASTHPLLVFTDSLQRFDRRAIQELLPHFDDVSVGAVTGTYEFGGGSAAPGLLRRFWAYELLLRELESRVDSVVAVTGAIYALRRELWTALPANLICDDLLVPMQVVRQGRRVTACSTSIASDDRRFTRAEEFSRKVRTLTGMIQFCALCPWALLPVKNRIWAQFVCHKLLRLATPYLAGLAAVALLVCVPEPSWVLPALAGLLVVALAVLLLAPRESALRKVRNQLVWAGYLLAAPVAATLNAVRGNWDIWSSGRRRPAA